MTHKNILQTIRQQLLERIAEITAAPKPTYSIDGQEVEWAEYLKSLRESVDWIDRQQAKSESPFEFVSRGES